MTRTRTLIALAAAALPALAAAQPLPPAQDWRGERAEHRYDQHEVAAARWDLARAEQLLARFDDARGRRDRRALAATEEEALRLVDRAVREARAELRHAEGRPGPRDDRRDLARVEAVRADLWSLRGRMERRALDRKRADLAELVQVARAELREDWHASREDWRASRERYDRGEHGRGF